MRASKFLRNSGKTLFGVIAMALAVTAAAGTAEAKHKHHFGVVLNFGAPDYAYYDAGYSCWWLKKKAINTGSRYWWRRYHDCVYG